jgi:hypothetical protein
MYKCNIDVRSRNNVCCGKVINVTCFESTFVALVIKREMCMRRNTGCFKRMTPIQIIISNNGNVLQLQKNYILLTFWHRSFTFKF